MKHGYNNVNVYDIDVQKVNVLYCNQIAQDPSLLTLLSLESIITICVLDSITNKINSAHANKLTNVGF